MRHNTTLAIVTISLFATPWATAQAAEGDLAKVEKQFGPPVMWVPKPKVAPVIDGKLDDAAWKQAKAVELGFLTGRWEKPTQKTVARVLADEKAVYLAVECGESQPERMISAGKQRDGELWNGDTVELFLDPGHKSKRLSYFHIIVNPRGLLYDGHGKTAGDWNAGIKAKAGKSASGWMVELAVPMKDLRLSGGIPKVWGLNVNRQRPKQGVIAPVQGITATAVPLKEPGKYREGEDTSWSPTWCESSHIAQRFGHAVLEVGTADVEPPEKLIEIIYKSDFDDGKTAGWSGVKSAGENLRGPGKCLAPEKGSGPIHFAKPLSDLDDVTLIYCLKMPQDGRLYYYGRAPDSEQCEADRHEVFMTKAAADARHFPRLHDYDTHGSMMAWRSHGRLREVPGPWSMMTGHFSEPSIGSVMSPGTDWVIVRTRLGMMRRQRSQGLVPMSQGYPRGLTFASGKPYFMDDVVIFRGADLEGPEQVTGVKVSSAGGEVSVSWARAKDNTITAYYQVLAGGKVLAETHGLSVKLKAGDLAGKGLTVVARDLYENASKPSAPALAK